MENIDGTRTVAILMRHIGEGKKEDRQEATQHVKGLWGKVKGTIIPMHEPNGKVE